MQKLFVNLSLRRHIYARPTESEEKLILVTLAPSRLHFQSLARLVYGLRRHINARPTLDEKLASELLVKNVS